MALAMRSICLAVIAALSVSGTYAMSPTDLCGGCQNGGNCTIDANGRPVCECGLCFQGALCEQPRIQRNPCLCFQCENGGTCTSPLDFPVCTCPPGFTGQRCEQSVGRPIFNPCANFTCDNGGRCIAPADGPFCDCPAGFGGARCRQTQKPGTCPKTDAGIVCGRDSCRNDFDCPGDQKCCADCGNRCTDPVKDNCPRQPCPVGEACTTRGPYCAPGRACPAIARFNCEPIDCLDCTDQETCVPIFFTPDGGQKYACIDPCANFECQNGGTCGPTPPAGEPFCFCAEGYTGEFCEVAIERPGTCPPVIPGSGGVCGGVVCKTDNECGAGEKCCDSACGGQLCTPVTIIFDPCANFECQNGGRCTAPADAPMCQCPDGFSGARCELTQRPCPTQPCPRGEVCVDKQPPCPPGRFCILALLPTCVPVDCANCATNEECVPISEATDLSVITPGGRYFCRPIIIRDPCGNYVCQNGGYCTAPADAPYCVCPDGYTGTFCEVKDSRPGTCPKITPDSAGVCGGIFCSSDRGCPDGQKCCPSACGGNLLCTNVDRPITLPPPPPLTCASVLCIIGTVCREVLVSPGSTPVPRCINQTLISPDFNNVCLGQGYAEALLAESGSQPATYSPASCRPETSQSCPDGYVCVGDSRGGGVCCTGKPCGNSVCAPGETCVQKQPYCAPGMACIQALIPTCVPLECANCAYNEECVPVIDPVKRYQCAPSGDCRTQGCAEGQECKQFTICVDPAPGSPPSEEFGCRDVYECDATQQQDRCGGCPRGQTCELLYPPCPPPPDCEELRDEDPNALCPVPVCEPIPTCVGDVSEPDKCGGCPDDQVCRLTNVVCITTPCDPVPQCVPADPCARCDDDDLCIRKPAENCFRYPCPDTYQCVENDNCGGECDNDEVCIDTGIRCITEPCPTFQCVKNNQCGGCRPDQVCIDTGIRCITEPCPTFQCVENNQCGGCSPGQVCVDTGIRCFTAPCPTFQCVDEKVDECGGCPEGQRCDFVYPPCARPPDCDVLRELDPEAECITPSCDPVPICVDDPQTTAVSAPQPEVCPLRCPHNYRCQFRQSSCRYFFCLSKRKQEAECVLVEPEARTCPVVSQQRDANSLICRMERFVQRNECVNDYDCKGKNEKCCTSKCNRKVCLDLSRRVPFLF